MTKETEPKDVWTTSEEAYDSAAKGDVIVCVPTFEVWDPKDLKHCPGDTMFAGLVNGHFAIKGAKSKRKTIELLDSFIGDARELSQEEGKAAPEFGSS